MKHLSIRSLASLVFALALSSPAADWKLTWSDEFGTPGLPDKGKWGCATGFVRNNELHYFTFDLDLGGTGPDNPFRKPHYLLINLALGGAWGGPMHDAVLPQKYLIDSVRGCEAKRP